MVGLQLSGYVLLSLEDDQWNLQTHKSPGIQSKNSREKGVSVCKSKYNLIRQESE